MLLPGLAAESAPTRAAPWPICIPRRVPVQLGVREVGRVHRGRLITLALRSRARGNIQHVDVLLPRHYDRSGRYRVLYLLHGAGGDYRSWIDQGVQRLLGNLPVIAVMPSGSQSGQDGGYSDWYGTPAGSVGPAPAWESYHIRELVPFIDSHFPTLRTAAGRAIAGISMGGGGATWLRVQFRHPPPPPRAFDVASAHVRFTAWGWSFRVQRRIREFVYLQVGRGGRRIIAVGSGRLSVHTPGGSAFVMNLGPSHTRQQTRFGSSATRHWRRVTLQLNAGVWSAVRRR